MPKENINCTVVAEFRAEVSWWSAQDGNDGYVQLGTVNTRSTLVMPASADDAADEVADLRGGNIPPVTTTNTLVERVPEPFHGWFITLDRAQINRLIRCLRKARDSAFGPDA